MATDFSGYQPNSLPGDRNDYIPPNAAFDLKINKVFVKETRQKGDAFIAEFEVLDSSLHDPRYAKGRPVSFYQSLSHKDVAYQKIAVFILAAAGIDRNANPAQAAEVMKTMGKLMQEAVTTPILEGRRVRCESSATTSKKDPTKTYTNYRWSPLV